MVTIRGWYSQKINKPNRWSCCESATIAAIGFAQMETPDRYREFAAECYRLASDAKSETESKTLLEIARALKEVADEAETKTLYAA
jgi:hypothetical protein